MNEFFERLVDLCALPANHRDVALRLEHQLKGSGFAYYSYIRFRGEIIDYNSSLPTPWCEEFIRKKYATTDPIVIEAKRRRAITGWMLSPKDTRLTKNVRKMYCELTKLGICSGVSVPVAIGFGHWALFSLLSKSPALPALSTTDPVLASAAVAQLHGALAGRGGPGGERKLSLREARCLRWIAEGKSLGIAAELEGLSYSGARFFLGSAKTALGAVSLPQATALAREMKLI